VSVWRRPAFVGIAGKGVELLTLVPLVIVLPRSFGPAGYRDFALALTVVTLSSASAALTAFVGGIACSPSLGRLLPATSLASAGVAALIAVTV
jgi:hypothetical protein